MKLNPHLETWMRATGVFLGVFFATGWSRKNSIKYDTPLFAAAVVLAFALRM